jgi:uncharacterized protein YndB with AHSA1/START domain
VIPVQQIREVQMSAVDSVHLIRQVAASPEQVFAAWTNAALLQRWLAPKAEADARLGGRFRLEVAKPEGSHIVTGEYRELVRNRRLVMTWVYEGPMAPSGTMEALLTVDLHPDGPNTKITLHHEHLSNPTYRETIEKGAWTKALDQMEVVLSEPGQAADKARA